VKKPSNKKNKETKENSDDHFRATIDIPSFIELPTDVAKSDNTSIISKMFENAAVVDLSTAKANWYFGEWQALVELNIQELADHPDVDKLAALKASAYQQLNDMEQSKAYFKLAKELGCDNYLISQLLIAGVHNSLGKVAALNKDDDKMLVHFDAAVNVGGNLQENKLARQARSVKEISKLGLLPQAAKLLTTEKEMLDVLSTRPSQHQAQLKILNSEVEIINHELMLAYQKSQLYSNDGIATPVFNEDGSVNIDRLKQLSPSQLGQDLWVLKQTKYKKNGFFVEFGATDGVLLSNSYLLEQEFGWDGICAEPNPKYFKLLNKNRKCTVSNSCISARTGEKVEFILANEYGGIADTAKAGKHGAKVRAYEEGGGLINVETISLHDFLIQNNAPKTIDYMSIDTEGSEYIILSTFPFSEWTISFLSIEHNYEPQRELIYKLLSSLNYERVTRKWDDLYVLIR
jgi:FkbM family methyltransferase